MGGILGYLIPSLYIDRRIAKRRMEHRTGFPDFMDLLVVCADSGLSMEAAMERVGRIRQAEALHQLWAGHENIAKGQNTSCHHGLVHDRADTKGNIDGILDQVHAPLG